MARRCSAGMPVCQSHSPCVRSRAEAPLAVTAQLMQPSCSAASCTWDQARPVVMAKAIPRSAAARRAVMFRGGMVTWSS